MKVFIDGSHGTTGLQIRSRLAAMEGIDLITLSQEKRKDPAERKEAMNRADAVFLCLPDSAAIEAAAMMENPDTVVFDTSTAHRTDPGWVYGMPELGKAQYEAMVSANRIAVPGCHASGFILLTAPLVKAGLLSADALLTCTSLTGYTGGGKSMIAEYEHSPLPEELQAPRQYALSQNHKHLKEMVHMTGLAHAPAFLPIVASYPRGMEVTVPLFASLLQKGGAEDIRQLYAEAYPGPVVYCGSAEKGGFLAANAMAGKDSMLLCVLGCGDRILLTALYDNLGKGACGAAIQCLNIRMGLEPTNGLNL